MPGTLKSQKKSRKMSRKTISDHILNINASGSISVLDGYILGLASVVVVRLYTRAVSSLQTITLC